MTKQNKVEKIKKMDSLENEENESLELNDVKSEFTQFKNEAEQVKHFQEQLANYSLPEDLDLGSLSLADDFLLEASIDAVEFETLHDIRPGVAQHYFEIVVHTKPAYGLILGRKKESPEEIIRLETELKQKKAAKDTEGAQEVLKQLRRTKRPILGLFQFAGLTRKLITGSYDDDPFADKLLIQIEEYMDQFDKRIDIAIATVMEKTRKLEENGIKAQKMRSKYPVIIPLKSNSPYAMRLAYLISKFDQLTRLNLPLRQMQIITPQDWNNIFYELRSLFRQAVHVAIQYRIYEIGITRELLAQYDPADKNKTNALIKRVIRKHGVVSEEILSKTKQPHILYSASESQGMTSNEG